MTLRIKPCSDIGAISFKHTAITMTLLYIVMLVMTLWFKKIVKIKFYEQQVSVKFRKQTTCWLVSSSLDIKLAVFIPNYDCSGILCSELLQTKNFTAIIPWGFHCAVTRFFSYRVLQGLHNWWHLMQDKKLAEAERVYVLQMTYYLQCLYLTILSF